MNKKFYRHSWADFFEKYLLPTNPSSRTRIFAYLAKKRASKDGLSLWMEWPIDIKLKKRIQSADRYIRSHILWWVMHQMITIPIFSSSIEIWMVSTFVNLLINGYPILVQMNIRDRCSNVIQYKKGDK
jgi:hypothetical protein